MSINRIFAMVLRYTLNMRHSFDRLSDMFYWPAMDLLIWGLTGLYLAQLGKNSPHYLSVILIGLIFWLIIWRAQSEISINILSELWDRNLVNIFASPLKISEWIISFMIMGLIKTIISLIFTAALAFYLYKFNILSYGFYLIPFIGCLLMTGWAGGFFISGFLIRYGQKIQTIAWAGIAIIAPFSAVYYPLSVLPQWAQKVGLFIPSTYIFEGIRQILFTGHISLDKIILSIALNIFFLIVSVLFFIHMFNKSKKLGLGRLI